MPLSMYLDQKLLSEVFGGTAYSGPATLYIGVSTQAVAGATQANVASGEPTIGTGGYARIVVTNNTTNFPAASSAVPSVSTSGAIFSFPVSTAAWSTAGTNLIQVAIFDAASAGNLLAYGALTVPFAVAGASITPSFALGAITISQS